MAHMLLIFLILLGYILGSIPFGYVVGIMFKTDVTKVGSGNIGATNISRIFGVRMGITVFILDMLKGTLAVVFAIAYLGDPMLIIFVGLAAILGHMFSIFLKFKGGKGSAVGLGVLLGLAPDVFFFTFIIVILVMLISRYVSLASIIGSFTASILMVLVQKPTPYITVTLLGTLLILYKHKENIGRLIQGTERKIGEKA